MSKNTRNRILLTALAALLLVTLTIGGTVAWLTDKTQTITNTFTTSNVDITLDESTGTSYKMVPGATINKNPSVTVIKGSEPCWVFVTVQEVNNTFNDDKYVQYTIGKDWTQLTDDKGNKVDGVYYKEIATAAENDLGPYQILEGKTVTINSDITNDIMDTLEKNGKPQLIFTAYAIQKETFGNAYGAWQTASTLDDQYTTTSTNGEGTNLEAPADGE